jgi:V/A-type H+-transporting ATPase subunit F
MTCLCIADADTVLGFRLAGIPGITVRNPHELLHHLDAACANPAVGLVLVSQSIADAARERVDAIRLVHTRPLIVEIPNPADPAAPSSTLQRLLRCAIGSGFDPATPPTHASP